MGDQLRVFRIVRRYGWQGRRRWRVRIREEAEEVHARRIWEECAVLHTVRQSVRIGVQVLRVCGVLFYKYNLGSHPHPTLALSNSKRLLDFL